MNKFTDSTKSDLLSEQGAKLAVFLSEHLVNGQDGALYIDLVGGDKLTPAQLFACYPDVAERLAHVMQAHETGAATPVDYHAVYEGESDFDLLNNLEQSLAELSALMKA